MNYMQFDEQEFRDLITEHNKARKEGQEMFLFRGEYELVTDYTWFLIEYLSTKFPHIRIKQNKNEKIYHLL